MTLILLQILFNIPYYFYNLSLKFLFLKHIKIE